MSRNELDIVAEASDVLHSKQYFKILNLKIEGKGLMTTRFWFYSNSRGTDEIRALSISIDFRIQKHGVITPI